MRRELKGIVVVLGCFWGMLQTAQGTVIDYELTNIGGNNWEYTYTVTNDTLGIGIEEFTIFYELGLTENLSAGATPANWDPLVVEPDPFIPDDGFYDALALLGPGILPSSSLGGYSVRFDFLGSGTPGSQRFDVVDPNTFFVLDSGATRSAVSVPEPGTLWLFGIGLLGLTFLTWRRSPSCH